LSALPRTASHLASQVAGKPDAWKLARPVWGWGRGEVSRPTPPKFCAAFRDILEAEAINSVRLPPQSPNLNAHLERFFGSLESECLDKIIFFGERSLRTAVGQYLLHFHRERNHQGLGNTLIEPGQEVGQTEGGVQYRERPGGLLRYYYRDAT